MTRWHDPGSSDGRVVPGCPVCCYCCSAVVHPVILRGEEGRERGREGGGGGGGRGGVRVRVRVRRVRVDIGAHKYSFYYQQVEHSCEQEDGSGWLLGEKLQTS